MSDSLETTLKRSRDPVAWMALADIYEERQEPVVSGYWRRLAIVGKVLLPLVKEMAKPSVLLTASKRESRSLGLEVHQPDFFHLDGVTQRGNEVRANLSEEICVVLRRTPKLVRVEVDDTPPAYPPPCRHICKTLLLVCDKINDLDRSRNWRYLRFKLSTIADYLE